MRCRFKTTVVKIVREDVVLSNVHKGGWKPEIN